MNARQRRQARRTPEAVAWRALTNARDAGYFDDLRGAPETTMGEAIVKARAFELVGRKDVTVKRFWEVDGPGFFEFSVGGYHGRDVRG